MQRMIWLMIALFAAILALRVSPAEAHEHPAHACDRRDSHELHHADNTDRAEQIGHASADDHVAAGDPDIARDECGCSDDHSHCECGCVDCDGPGCGDCGCSHGIAAWALPAARSDGPSGTSPDAIAAIDAVRPPAAPRSRLLQPPRAIFEA